MSTRGGGFSTSGVRGMDWWKGIDGGDFVEGELVSWRGEVGVLVLEGWEILFYHILEEF